MLSEITQITPNGTFDSKHGTLYKFEYVFKDGTVLGANHKTQDSPFKVGDIADYEIKGTNDYGSWGKVQKPESANFNGQQRPQNTSAGSTPKDDIISRLACLKASAEFYAQSSTNENDVIMTAERWFQWAKTGNIVAKVETEDNPF